MTSQIDKTLHTFWKTKEAISPSGDLTPVKSVKRIKSPKKQQDYHKSLNDIKIEDVFLNSEYFKCQSGNISSLSFCSGDNGENKWKVDSKFEIPLKRKSAKIVSYASDTIKSDTAVLEKDKMGGRIQQKLKKPTGILKNNTELISGMLTGEEKVDRDLISLITDQMFLAERELQLTRTHLIETISKLNERDLEIIQLHEKIQNLQKNQKTPQSDAEGMTKSAEDYQRLIKASEKLKKQVKDMGEFLNDYGLVWVGDRDVNQKPDFDKIIKSFQNLNSVASEPKIIQTNIGAKFEVPREIGVVLYANGLLLRNKEFREYNKPATVSFLQDVEDGYFPSELQNEFPEGVPFEVVDKRNEIYNTNTKSQVFQGRGNRLGSTFEGKPPSVVFLEPLKHTPAIYETLDQYTQKKLHKKKNKNSYQQDEKTPQGRQRTPVETADKEIKEEMKVKIRFGKNKTESFVLLIEENEKMYAFQTALHRKLCEKYHEDFPVSDDSSNLLTDLEIHVYGKTPFRLSENLSKYPRECGITSNCLINVTEI